MVDYESFLEALDITIVSKPRQTVPDSFDWEERVISRMKAYIHE